MMKLLRRLVLCATVTAAFALALVLCGTVMAAEPAPDEAPGAAAPEAKAVPYSGKCGENLTWTLDAAGTLTISGTGYMEDYIMPGVGTVDGVTPAPWSGYGSDIKALVVESGVESLGEEAFSYTSIKTAELPDTLTGIGVAAFSWCSSLEEIDIPSGVETIGYGAFSMCVDLRSVGLPKSLTTVTGQRI